MSDQHNSLVPVWTLATADNAGVAGIAAAAEQGALTPARLADLRSALAAFASAPLVTLEAHPLPARREKSKGLPLDAGSQLARELSQLVESNAKNVPAVAQVAESGEVLYRMVVPAKVAARVGNGLVKPMKSKAVTGGIYDNLVDAGTNLVAAKATFVPVESAAAGAAGAGVGVAAAGTALTVAAPLVLMAVAVGASAYAEQQRQDAIEHITELLGKLLSDKLEEERNELDGCRDAIDKATALLLDQGKVGATLGLDSAVHAISTGSQAAEHRVAKWEAALDTVVDNRVDVSELEAAFPGVGEHGGEFRTHVELAALAIALKRRVVILQAVAAGQSDPENGFENFVRSLNADQKRIDELEGRIRSVLLRLSALELRPPKQIVHSVMTRKQVDELLDSSYLLRDLQHEVSVADPSADVVIEIEKHQDGTLLVLPAREA